MKATCCICSDPFGEVYPISATACGHVYHTNCVMSWIGQCKTCPICRTQLNSATVLRLFFNFDTSNVVTTSDLEDEISDLKSHLKAKDLVLKDCEKENEKMKDAAKVAEKKAADLQQLLYKSQTEGIEMKLKIKALSITEAKVLNLEETNSALTHNLQILNDVRSMITGSKKEVDEILEKLGNGPKVPRILATFVQAMKLKLLQAVDSKRKMLEFNRKLRQCIINIRFSGPSNSVATVDPSGSQGNIEVNSAPQRDTLSGTHISNSASIPKNPAKRFRQNDVLATPYLRNMQFPVSTTSRTATVTRSSINTVTSVPVSTAPIPVSTEVNSDPQSDTLSGSNISNSAKRMRQNEILTTPYLQNFSQIPVSLPSRRAAVTRSRINTVTSVAVSTAPIPVSTAPIPVSTAPIPVSTAPSVHDCVCCKLTYGVPAEIVAISPVPFPNLKTFNMPSGSVSTSSNRHE